MHPLVAVVTPVYNGSAYLDETMQSVQAQEYPNLLHIVLDNASTDATPAIIERYTNARVPIHVTRNETLLPLVANWNAAVRLVPPQAKYFRVLSADDLLSQGYLSATVDLAERHKSVGVVGCLYHTTTDLPIVSPWPADTEVFDGRWAIQRMLDGGAWLPSAHSLYRTEELRRSQPFYDDRVFICDLDASLRLLTRTDLGFVHADLATTRLHMENQSETFVERYKINMCEWLYFLERYAPEAFEKAASDEAQRLYRRYYLRQLIKWRVGSRGDIYALHVEKLRNLGVDLPLSDYADAIGDWILVQLGLRPVWGGYSNRPYVSRLSALKRASK